MSTDTPTPDEIKAAVAIEIARYVSTDLDTIEETALEMMRLSLETLKTIRDGLNKYKATHGLP